MPKGREALRLLLTDNSLTKALSPRRGCWSASLLAAARISTMAGRAAAPTASPITRSSSSFLMAASSVPASTATRAHLKTRLATSTSTPTISSGCSRLRLCAGQPVRKDRFSIQHTGLHRAPASRGGRVHWILPNLTGGACMRRRISLAIALLSTASAGLACASLFYCFAFPETVYATPQRHRTPGSLSGVVVGMDDKPVPHASVNYQSSAGYNPHAVRTDSTGHFHIAKLRADNYDLRATAKGVFSEWKHNVAVGGGRDANVTLRLIYSRGPSAATKPPATQK